MKRNRPNNDSNADFGFGAGHGYMYGQHGNGYPPGPPGGQSYSSQIQHQGSSAYGYNNGAVGGAPGWQHQPQGPPMTHQQQQHQHQQQQQPQFRGQWNDYDSGSQRSGNSYRQHQHQHQHQSQEMTHYSQTQPSQEYGGSQYGSSQVADHPTMDPPQPRKRQRATKRRVRQPLSGPAGIWFRMNKKAASASASASAAARDTKEGIVQTAADDAFGFEEAAAVAHQVHDVMADRNRKERERREEEEMKGGAGDADDADDVDMLYDEETGQNAKVPRGTTSTYEATLGRAWDVMCISMDRIVPEPSVYLHNHQRQPYREIRAALDGSPCDKLRHFGLLSEIMGRDGPNRDIGIAGSGGRLRVGHLVVSIASVHNNNHCDWTVELRDETVTNSSSSSSSSSTPGGRPRDGSVSGGDDDQDAGASMGASSIMGWVEEDLLKDHPDWIRPGVVLYLRDAACTVFEAVSAGAGDDVGGSSGAAGGGGSSLLSSGNGLDRMLLISETSVVCVWTPESHMDREDFLNLIERRNMARDRIKEEEITDLTQDHVVGEEPNGKGVVFKTSPPSSQMASGVYAHPKAGHVEIYDPETHNIKASSTQEEGENTAIDLTSDDIGNKENQEENDAFITETTMSLDGANLESLPADVGQDYSGAGTSSLPTSDRDPNQKQQNDQGPFQEHSMMDGTAQSVLSNPYARAPSTVDEDSDSKQNEVAKSQECGGNIVREAVESNPSLAVDDEMVLNGDSTNDTEATGEPSQPNHQDQTPATHNPYQKTSSEPTLHALLPNNTVVDAAAVVGRNDDTKISSKADTSPSKEEENGGMETDAKNNEASPEQNPEAKTSTQTTTASSIWATTGTDGGGEETGDDYDMFSSGLSSTQDESLSPMVPSKHARSSAVPQKSPTEATESPRSAKKANNHKPAGTSGIFSGACEDMFDDLGEEDDDDDF